MGTFPFHHGSTTHSANGGQVCKYEIRDRQDPVKGSGWVLFPSTMAEQPIQQMVVGHLCFQERAEQSLYVCMYVIVHLELISCF